MIEAKKWKIRQHVNNVSLKLEEYGLYQLHSTNSIFIGQFHFFRSIFESTLIIPAICAQNLTAWEQKLNSILIFLSNSLTYHKIPLYVVIFWCWTCILKWQNIRLLLRTIENPASFSITNWSIRAAKNLITLITWVWDEDLSHGNFRRSLLTQALLHACWIVPIAILELVHCQPLWWPSYFVARIADASFFGCTTVNKSCHTNIINHKCNYITCSKVGNDLSLQSGIPN